jgi:PAS domain S-box-containing protein
VNPLPKGGDSVIAEPPVGVDNGRWASPQGKIAAGRAPPHLLLEALVLALLVFATGLLATQLSRLPGSVAMIWFANAIGMAFLAVAPKSRWPVLLLSAAAGNLAANLAADDSLTLSLAFLPANLCEILIGAELLRRADAVSQIEDRPVPLLRMLAAGVLLPPVAGALIGGGMLHVNGFAEFNNVWFDWYVGDVIGAAATLPLALRMRQATPADIKAQMFSRRALALALIACGITLGALAALPYPFVYLTLPVIIAAALVPPMAAFAVCWLVMMAVVVAVDCGIFALPATPSPWQHTLVYGPALLAVLPAQFLSLLLQRNHWLQHSLSAMTAATDDLTSVVGRDGTYLVVNRAYERRWQRSRNDFIGRKVHEVMPRAVYERDVRPRLERALAGETVSYHATFDFPGTGPRAMDVSYSPAYSPDGSMLGVLVHAHDVQELVASRHALEETVLRLRSTNDDLEQFVRMTSHDLREPLNTIVQFGDLLNQEGADQLTDRGLTYLTLVQDGGRRMRRMLDDLLQFVRLDQCQESPRSIELDGLLRQVEQSLYASIRERNAVVQLQGPLPAVCGSETLITLVFQNLLSNAIKFVPAERTPQIRVYAREAKAGGVEVVVEDNGIGITEADRKRLFQPFVRLHSRRRFDGVGLGLATCRRITESLGGSVSVEPAPVQGSAFVVRLPLA